MEDFEDIILEGNEELFEEIENYSKKENLAFIKFIIERHPPRNLLNLDKSLDEEWKENKIKLLKVLRAKYDLHNYPRNTYEEKVKYEIVSKIIEHLNRIYHYISLPPVCYNCYDD